MKGIMMVTQDICGMAKGPRRHKVTWWWDEEVAEAVRDNNDRLQLQQQQQPFNGL